MAKTRNIILGSVILVAAVAFLIMGLASIFSATLVMAALLAIHLQQGSSRSTLGWVGIAVATASLGVILFLRPSPAGASSIMGTTFDPRVMGIFAFLAFLAGNLLLGVATNRAHVFRSNSGTWLPLSLLALLIAGWRVPYAAALAWIAIQLLRGSPPAATILPPVGATPQTHDR